MKPNPGEQVGCRNCQTVFELPTPATDVLYVPTCPDCDSVVEGYEDAADTREKTEEAREACQKIEHELNEIIERTREERTATPEGTALRALRRATEDLDSVGQFANNKSEQISAED